MKVSVNKDYLLYVLLTFDWEQSSGTNWNKPIGGKIIENEIGKIVFTNGLACLDLQDLINTIIRKHNYAI